MRGWTVLAACGSEWDASQGLKTPAIADTVDGIAGLWSAIGGEKEANA